MDDRMREMRWSSAMIPVPYRDLRLSDLRNKYDEIDERAFGYAQGYIENFGLIYGANRKRDTAGKGFTLLGAPGRGKTEIMAAVMQEIHLKYRANIMFVPFAKYITMLIEQIKWGNKNGDPFADEQFWEIQRVIDKVENRALVLFDDVGKEHKTNSGFAEDTFDLLLRDRFNRGLPTLLTSNVEIGDWAGNYGPAMESFLYQAAPPIKMRGKDYRK